MKKIILSLFVSICILFISSPIFAATQSDITNTYTQIETLKKEIQELDNRINEIEAQTNTLNNDIAVNTENLLAAQKEEAEMIEESKERINAIYMYGTEGYFNYLFSAENPSDFISYYDIAKDILTADKDNVNELKKKRQEVEKLQEKLTNDRNTLVELKKQAEASRAQKQSALASNLDAVDILESQLEEEDFSQVTSTTTPIVSVSDETNQNVARQTSVPSILAVTGADGTSRSQELMDASGLLDSSITDDAVLSEAVNNSNESGEITTEDGISAAMTVPKWMAPDETQTVESSTLVSIPDNFGGSTVISLSQIPGSWVWPLDANGSGAFTITSLMGTRESPGGVGSTDHGGTDIGAAYGTAILAADAGTVTIAGTYGGYGNAVMIDHGNGYKTIYGHMSSIAVRVGQQVQAGQIIGFVGSTGWSTGPHLHFEVRYNNGGFETKINGLSLYGEEVYNRLKYAL